MKRTFHHIGLVATQPVAGEMYFESLKVWGTDPSKDANKVEWVRFKPDSPLASTPVAKGPHVSYQVDDLDAALKAENIKPVVGPLNAAPNIRIAYFWQDGGLVEYLEVK